METSAFLIGNGGLCLSLPFPGIQYQLSCRRPLLAFRCKDLSPLELACMEAPPWFWRPLIL